MPAQLQLSLGKRWRYNQTHASTGWQPTSLFKIELARSRLVRLMRVVDNDSGGHRYYYCNSLLLSIV